MPLEPVSATDHPRIVASVPFVTTLARRMASSMARSVDLGDLVQDGILGLIDALRRFDASRGIDFHTFAERRVRGAMIDALRRHAWPRGVRRQRRDVDAARAALRVELGHEPEVAALAARVGLGETRFRRLMARIQTIEALSPLAAGQRGDDSALPTALVPSPVESPHHAYEKHETRQRLQQAVASLPAREQQVITRYYYGDVTMKDIGVELGVNESRVSQLHTRAIRHLRAALDALESCRPDPRVNADACDVGEHVHQHVPDDGGRVVRSRLNG